ncbi:MAG: bifunctional precorrin-2 dehydrogenase/sirohydrochlorin ferrochelatase [Nitrospirales bacterium]|nr:bifunctional precorrin-2 dehydrogenase/sirohydrochlorin ferrochelatase [Nitrospirales bacterium]
MNSGFQISLNVRGRTCLVIGGDEEAVEKIDRLLDAEAKVTVLNPTLHPALRKLTASAKIVHRGRTFRTTDVQSGVALVLNTIREDLDLAKLLFDLAKTEGFLVWSIDQPELSTVMMPAIVRRGPLRVAISTSGASPALAKALRQDLEMMFDDEFVECLQWLGSVREELRKEELSENKRRERLQQILEGFRLEGKIELPKSWTEKSKASKNDGTVK